MISVTEEPSPFRCKNHVCLRVGERVVLFGGYCEDDRNLDHLWHTNTTATRAWTRVSLDHAPGPRNGHAGAAIDDKRMLIVGGWSGSRVYDDVWELDCETWVWEKWPGVSLRCNMCTAAQHGGIVYLFRGGDGQSYHADVWALDPRSRQATLVETRGHGPGPRAGFSVAAFGDDMYLGGGWDGARRFGDLYRFHVPTRTWHPFPRTLPAVAGAAMGVHLLGPRLYLVMCGGTDEDRAYDPCTYAVDTSAPSEESSDSPSGTDITETPPTARAGHRMVALGAGTFLVVGGCGASANCDTNVLLDVRGVRPTVWVDAANDSVDRASVFADHLETGRFADVLLRVNDELELIPAHRIVLAASNERFAAQLSARWDSPDHQPTSLPVLGVRVAEGVGVATFRKVLAHMYSGRLPGAAQNDVLGGDTTDLLVLAEEYMLPCLKRHCEREIARSLLASDSGSVAEVLGDVESFARTYGADQLLAVCAYLRLTRGDDGPG